MLLELWQVDIAKVSLLPPKRNKYLYCFGFTKLSDNPKDRVIKHRIGHNPLLSVTQALTSIPYPIRGWFCPVIVSVLLPFFKTLYSFGDPKVAR